ncbi:hypothetical protein AAFF_G00095360 [Aldrovandia affinis]|uniref:Uncharacterized protein n=1 Tax=Aldrovandia affinis TaxID=143900 RepID=A0AAD7RVT0_9TELE|nr:hypothetical protein AAFF_G00095360 [Aldrovandia affinis]
MVNTHSVVSEDILISPTDKRPGREGVSSANAAAKDAITPRVAGPDRSDLPTANKGASAATSASRPNLATITNYGEAASPSSTAAGLEPLTNGGSTSEARPSEVCPSVGREEARASLEAHVDSSSPGVTKHMALSLTDTGQIIPLANASQPSVTNTPEEPEGAQEKRGKAGGGNDILESFAEDHALKGEELIFYERKRKRRPP